MRIKELARHWQEQGGNPLTDERYAIHLPVYDAAKIEALSQLFPGCSVEQIIQDLLAAALHDLESALPYEQGQRVVAEDEHGDPIYADEGLTPRLLALTEEIVAQKSTQGK